MKNTNLILLTLLFAFGIQFSLNAQQHSKAKEILLIGTFHFNNPGLDAVKTNRFDVTIPKPQNELETITDQIKKYNPDQIFVEWDFDDQPALDSLYNAYLGGNYADQVTKKAKTPRAKAFYQENEIFQLAFRAGKKSALKKITAIDYGIDLPFDSVMKAMNEASQTGLINFLDSSMKAMGKTANTKRKTMSLTELILDLNTQTSRDFDNGFYTSYFNKAGKRDNFAGAQMVSEWYRRNLYMYALLQKLTLQTDKRIMVLLGASHIAMFRSFLSLDKSFKVIELKDILDKKSR